MFGCASIVVLYNCKIKLVLFSWISSFTFPLALFNQICRNCIEVVTHVFVANWDQTFDEGDIKCKWPFHIVITPNTDVVYVLHGLRVKTFIDFGCQKVFHDGRVCYCLLSFQEILVTVIKLCNRNPKNQTNPTLIPEKESIVFNHI